MICPNCEDAFMEYDPETGCWECPKCHETDCSDNEANAEEWDALYTLQKKIAAGNWED